MAKNPLAAIEDILETIDRIRRKLEGVPFEAFRSDWELQFLAQRAIEIISEASRRIPANMRAGHPEIEWRRVADIGNVLRHEYEAISDPLIWSVIQDDLPPLRAAVQAMREALEKGRGVGA
jgi:uncharacterized protein with HEPN domain